MSGSDRAAGRAANVTLPVTSCFTALVLLTSVAILLASTAPAPAQTRTLRMKFEMQFVGRSAPDFSLEDLSGETVRLSDFRGKVVLLNFWYSSCMPCRKETPALADLYREHRERDFMVLGLNLDSIFMPRTAYEDLAKFLAAIEVPYPILYAGREVYEAYGEVPVQPISLLVDRDGIIVKVFWGATSEELLGRVIPVYLDEPDPSSS